MYSYRIASLVLNDGTEFVPSDLTVFIGPNNAGKSQALKDVMFLGTRPGHNQRETVVIRNTRFSLPEKLDDLIEAYPSLNRVPDVNGNWHYHPLLGFHAPQRRRGY